MVQEKNNDMVIADIKENMEKLLRSVKGNDLGLKVYSSVY